MPQPTSPNGTKTFGTKLFTGTAGGSATTAISSIKSVKDLPKVKYDKYDDSTVDQTSPIKPYATTMADGGQAKFEFKHTDALFAQLLALHDGTNRGWKVTFGGAVFTSAAPTATFNGLIENFGVTPSSSSNGENTLTLEIQVTSLMVYAAGT